MIEDWDDEDMIKSMNEINQMDLDEEEKLAIIEQNIGFSKFRKPIDTSGMKSRDSQDFSPITPERAVGARLNVTKLGSGSSAGSGGSLGTPKKQR